MTWLRKKGKLQKGWREVTQLSLPLSLLLCSIRGTFLPDKSSRSSLTAFYVPQNQIREWEGERENWMKNEELKKRIKDQVPVKGDSLSLIFNHTRNLDMKKQMIKTRVESMSRCELCLPFLHSCSLLCIKQWTNSSTYCLESWRKRETKSSIL